MNKMRLNAAIKKYGQFINETEEAVKDRLRADSKSNYTEEEIEIIYTSILNGVAPTETAPKAPKVVVTTKVATKAGDATQSLNDGLGLEKFDYNNLTGAAFYSYLELLGSLPLYEKKDFTQYFASGVFEKQFDKDLNKVDVLVGIKINKADPINNTRIPVHVAVEMNRQIFDRNNPASNSRYYLLKK